MCGEQRVRGRECERSGANLGQVRDVSQQRAAKLLALPLGMHPEQHDLRPALTSLLDPAGPLGACLLRLVPLLVPLLVRVDVEAAGGDDVTHPHKCQPQLQLVAANFRTAAESSS